MLQLQDYLKLDKYAQYSTTFKNVSNIGGNLPNSPRTAELVDRRPTSNKYWQSLICIFSAVKSVHNLFKYKSFCFWSLSTANILLTSLPYTIQVLLYDQIYCKIVLILGL